MIIEKVGGKCNISHFPREYVLVKATHPALLRVPPCLFTKWRLGKDPLHWRKLNRCPGLLADNLRSGDFFFLFGGGVYAWYNCLPILLHLVQNLGFFLIGRETLDNMNLYCDWLPVKRFHIRSKNTLSNLNFHHGGSSTRQRKRNSDCEDVISTTATFIAVCFARRNDLWHKSFLQLMKHSSTIDNFPCTFFAQWRVTFWGRINIYPHSLNKIGEDDSSSLIQKLFLQNSVFRWLKRGTVPSPDETLIT